MTPILSHALIVGAVEALEADPELAARARRALGIVEPTTAAPPTTEALYLKVPAYAQRIDVSESTAWALLRKGLPTIGAGRSRRVDCRRADDWLRARRNHVDEAVERDARRRARKAASR
jgi:hypothetical protein